MKQHLSSQLTRIVSRVVCWLGLTAGLCALACGPVPASATGAAQSSPKPESSPQPGSSPKPEASTNAASSHQGAASIKLPVSLLDFMRASIEIPADGIWDVQSEEKVTDSEWLLVDQDSVSLASAATLIAVGGTGPKDAQWVSNADWQQWVRDLQKTALSIRGAGKAKDQEKLGMLADHLQEVCATCHAKYRPEVPSDGVARYPFYPKLEIKKGT